MHLGTGIAIIVAATALLLTTAFILRPRVSRRLTDVLAALGGAAVGVGGLLLLDQDVSAASWVVAPVALGLAAVANIRMLFAGSGPFRT